MAASIQPLFSAFRYPTYLRLAIAWLLLFPASLLSAEPPVSYSKFCASCGIWGADSFTSHSGQFIVHGTASIPAERPDANTNRAPVLALSPQAVAVTAERLKRGLLDELNLADHYRDKVHVFLSPLASPENSIAIISKVYFDGFLYQVGMPARLNHDRFTKSIVQVLLMEMANRSSNRAAELPPWLVDGFTEYLLTRIAPSSITNKTPVTIEIIGYDRLGAARAFLRTNTCLTVQELSFPRVATQADRQLYEASAHLFVHELLSLPNGRTLFTQFISALPSSLNWQTSFFRVYQQHFKKPLDLEKWWALAWVNFQTHEERETWPLLLSLQKLEALLHTPTEIRVNPQSIPERRDLPLQKLITDTDFSVHKDIIAEKLRQLFFLSYSLAPETHQIAKQYQATLQSYLDKRTVLPVQPALKSDPEQRLETLLRATTRKLDELDQAKASLPQHFSVSSAARVP